MRTLAAAALLVVLTTGVAGGDPPPTHSGVFKTARLEVRYRPGSRAAASVERTGAAAERDLDRIEKALEVKEKGPFTLYLYDDVPEMCAATGVDGCGGFSAGRESHIPYDDDQTRLHEMVHLVAATWPKTGAEARNLFPVEGLANAVLEHVHGVPVHAVAAYYSKRDRLPPLAELLGAADFYAWQREHPGFNAYDVAGSLLRWMIDTHGVAKTKRWYTGTAAKQAFGSDVAALEKAWREALAKFELRPEVETLLRQRDGEDVRFTTTLDAILGKDSDWKTFVAADARPREAKKWKSTERTFACENGDGVWTVLDLGGEAYGDCAVRATIETPAPVPVQVRLGDGNQVMLVNGTFVYRGEHPVASVPKPTMEATRKRTDLLVVRRGARLEVWVDGVRALSAPAVVDPALPGIGIHQGSATFRDVRVRRLP